MQKDTVKKLGAVGSAIVVALLFLSLPVMYFLLQAPAVIVAGLAVVFVIVAAVLVYCAYARFKEIDEGLEDAVDNY